MENVAWGVKSPARTLELEPRRRTFQCALALRRMVALVLATVGVFLLLPPEWSVGAPPEAPASVPTPAPVPAPTPAPRAPERNKQPTTPAIEGAYAVEGSGEGVRVRRLFGDIYHLDSSDGWEGVGILDGNAYRGVFRYRSVSDAADRKMGEHLIDWTAPETPTVQLTYAAARTDQLAQRWRRLPDPGQRATGKSASPGGPPREGAATSGGRPAFGEYVYVEELPEALTKVAPDYPTDMKPGVEATVIVQALVLENGTVGDVRVVQSVPMLDEAAIASVRQWRFKPAMSKGAPVAVWVAIPVKFGTR